MIILRDTREKIPWQWGLFPEVEIIDQKLDFGDYTLKGYENKIAIERKRSTQEICANLVSKDKHRFHREMEVLQDFKHAYIVCEFLESDIYAFPKKSGIPKRYHSKLRIGGKYLARVMGEVRDKYDIRIVYCQDTFAAEEFVFNLFKNISGGVDF